EAAEEEVLPLLTDGVSIAAVNGPRAVVLSGDESEVLRIAAGFGDRRTRRLRVSHAFHSPHMEPMLDAFARVAAALTRHAPAIPLISTVTGAPAGAEDLGAPDYWVRQVRGTVRFADAVRALAGRGAGLLLELGPDGTLTAAARDTLGDDGALPGAAALRRGRPEVPTLGTALATLFVHGTRPHWPAVFEGTGARRTDLPTYPFQRQRYWPEAGRPAPAGTDPVDAAFWAAVDQGDLSALDAGLDLDRDTVAALAGWRRGRREHAAVDAWRYRASWTPLDAAVSTGSTGSGPAAGRWLVLATEPVPWLERVVDQPVPLITPAGADRAALAELLRAAARESDGFTGVLSLLALGSDPLAATATAVQALGDADLSAPLWCLTRGAVSTGRSDRPADPRQAAVWGLGRSAALELPARWGGLVDLPDLSEPSEPSGQRDGTAQPDDTVLRRLAAALTRTDGEDQLAVRASGTFARRLVRHPIGDRPATRPYAPRGTVLITGGTGGLGGHLARHLAERGAGHLLLLSRSGADAPGADRLRADLAALGTEATLVACDVADRDALAAVLAAVPADRPLSAVFHTAGVVADGTLDTLDADRFAEVLRPKADAARHLDDLTREADLDAFVLFTSTAGTLGAAGQANYAAANAHLDALAEQRRADGRPATAIAWGPWAGEGMAGAGSGVEQRVRRGGYAPMAPGRALAALGHVLDHQDTALTVADIDWQRFAAVFTAQRPFPLIADLAGPAGRRADAAPESGLRQRVAELPEQARRRFLLDFVRSRVAAVLGHAGGDGIGADQAFTELGMDSLTTVELRNTLTAATGLTLSATLVYDHPTPADLAAHLLAELLGSLPETGRTAAPRPVAEDPVVITGMACRFPGGIETPEDLWRLLADGADAVRPFPTDRGWDLDALGQGGSATLHGGFLDDVGRFDARFFGISPREALAMDPQQRLLLETSWEALERSGIAPDRLRGSDTGVFVGTNGQDYLTVLRRGTADVRGHAATGNTASVLSGRLSYTLGLEGPAVTVDTACSSALVALHLAARALRAGECSLALAGGASVMSSPDAFVEFTAQGGLAADGRCKAFADAADGTAWSEGAGVLVLERLSDALRNGRPVLAVLRGSAVNQDGASNGLTAPNGRAQQRVIRAALADAGLTAGEVDAVEAHGTGTALGDPIEAHALQAAYGRERELPLLVGSVKSNLGHTQAAAGAAGVIKTVLALRAGVLPRTLHVDTPSRHIDWTAGAVELLAEAREWPETGRPRRAGVSAFGVSGTNAHVLLEQAPPAEPAPEAAPAAAVPVRAGAAPWVVSARSEAALDASLARLGAAVEGVSALDVAHSLAAGRASLAHRAVLLDGVEVARGLATDRAVAFLFSGQGSQRLGMGRESYARFPVFAEAFDAVCARLDQHLDQPLREVVWGADAELLNRTDFAQAGLFAVEVALFRLVESLGVRPEFVAGHSIGEIAAAHVAGVFSLADACALVAARGRLMQALPEGGAMLAIEATEEEVRPLLGESVALAAVNGPTSVVVSGAEEAVEALGEHFAERRTSRLRVSHAFHSALMDPMLADFRAVLNGLTYHAPSIPLVSNLTGELVSGTTDADYWVRHVRETVRFADGLATLLGAGAGALLELGPDGVLSALAQRSTGEHDCVVEPSCRRDRPEEHTLVTALARLHVAGVPVDWTALLAGTGAARVDLPTYPFQRERYWPERAPEPAAAGGDPADAAFWSAVERADTAALGTALGLADDSSLAELLPALSTWRRRQSARTDADRLRYRAAWRPYAVPAGPEALPEGWLAVLPAGRADDPWTTAALTALGPDVLRLETGRDGRAALVERLAPHAGAVTGVISLLAAEDTLPTGLARPDELLAALGEAGIEAPLWCLTRGAVAVGDTEAPDRPAQAAAWGIGRVIALEHPRRWGGLVDLAEAPDTRTAARLRALLTAPDGEDQLALRPSGAFARRLVRATTDADARPWTPHGTVLLIGDPDGHAAPTARWLARNGARQVVLLTAEDTADGSSAVERIEAELAGHGAGLSVVTGAPGDPAALASALGRPELTAVLHTGRTAAPGTPDEQLAGLLAELAALDTALGDRPLDAFLLFGSIAGTWGVKGRADEAAAGALLEAAAQSRRAAGRAALAVAWGAWTGSTPDSLAAHLRANGLPPIAPERALTALAAAADGPAAVTVAEVTWERFAPAFGETRTTRLFAELPGARRTAEPQQPGGGSARAEALRADLRDRSAAERTEALLALVRAEAAAVLGHADADDVPAGHPFKDLGFDSLTAVDLRNRLGTATGLKLPATLVFDYPSPAALAAHLRAELLDEAGEAERPVAAVDTDDPIVIVGMGCRYPGGVRSPEDLWQLLLDGTDAIGPFPTDRGWDLDRLAHGDRDGRGRSVTGHGGFLYDAAEFDAAFFGVSPREALVVDPQQRLLLETAWEALERAGIDPAGLRGGDTGVFVGGGSGDYRPAIGQLGHVETAQSASLLSGRLSYTLGLEGPSVSVDTACSSSLVALHLAAQALRAGECSLALAGGVTVMSSPVGFVEFGEMGALSPDGRCRAFSDGADGTGWSEGVGVLVVERRSDAERLGHRVLAVLRGSAVNQDGASNGITAPNGPSQQRVIRRALAGAGLTPGEVDAVEAHGTGTRLGDPIEAQALLATYGQDRERPVLIGALKSNLGHTQAASGVGGVIKMVLAMRHGLLPRTLHLDTPSAHVDWTAGAAELLTEARDWPESGRPRRAGVSAFGASGTNAHVILEQAAEEPPPAAGDRPDDRTLPVPLSAATPEALREQAARLLDRLAGHPGLTVRDLGHSLATTRALLDHRAVLLAADREELVRGLRALADGNPGGEAVQGSARSARTAFLFPGQGSQRPGAGSGLYASEPVFAEALDAVLAGFEGRLAGPLREVLFAVEGSVEAGLLDDTGFAQPALFAL
ncbi:type I polyketide synthase, partial [Kitasatospora aureofaciens]|uniref:type I polyketide synthase n=1 Tax=Kitasatospora aureofaciens TaxID=1894 RepID=UPI0033D1B404